MGGDYFFKAKGVKIRLEGGGEYREGERTGAEAGVIRRFSEVLESISKHRGLFTHLRAGHEASIPNPYLPSKSSRPFRISVKSLRLYLDQTTVFDPKNDEKKKEREKSTDLDMRVSDEGEDGRIKEINVRSHSYIAKPPLLP